MPRLFTALEIGSAAQDLVAAEQRKVADALRRSSLRWVKHDQLHITLVFLGQLSDAQAAQAVDVLSEPIRQTPLRFELGGLGVFPPNGPPRALWIGVTSGAEPIVAVQSEVAQRVQSIGVETERRPFTPHLTLARWKDGRRSDRPITLTTSRPVIATVEVSAVTLFQSRVSSDGSIYTVVAQAPLIAP